jgi:hypothetical protein
MHGDGRFFRRGRLWWIEYIRNGHEYRESSGSADQEVAQRLLRERLSAPDTDLLTIRDLIKRPHLLAQIPYRDVEVLYADCRKALEHLRRRLHND